MALNDPVNSPKHYTQGDMEVITAIEGMGLDYHQGNIVKYVSRYRYKGGIEDLQIGRAHSELQSHVRIRMPSSA